MHCEAEVIRHGLILCIVGFSESCNRFAGAVTLNFDNTNNCKSIEFILIRLSILRVVTAYYCI